MVCYMVNTGSYGENSAYPDAAERATLDTMFALVSPLEGVSCHMVPVQPPPHIISLPVSVCVCMFISYTISLRGHEETFGVIIDAITHLTRSQARVIRLCSTWAVKCLVFSHIILGQLSGSSSGRRWCVTSAENW